MLRLFVDRAVALRRGVVLVHIHFAHFDAAAVIGGNFIHDRRQRAARAAPGCPEINDYRNRGLDDFLVKVIKIDMEQVGMCIHNGF